MHDVTKGCESKRLKMYFREVYEKRMAMILLFLLIILRFYIAYISSYLFFNIIGLLFYL